MNTAEHLVKEMRDFIIDLFIQNKHWDPTDYRLDIIHQLSNDDLSTLYEIFKSSIFPNNIEYTAAVETTITFYFYYVKGDYRRAAIWLQKLADRGDTDAMMRLASLYSETYYGLEQNYPRALQLITQAANLGNTDAMNKIALLYRGCGKSRFALAANYTLAVEWFKRSLLQDGNCCAARCLADSYRYGLGTEKDLLKYEMLHKYADTAEVANIDEVRLILGEAEKESYCEEE